MVVKGDSAEDSEESFHLRDRHSLPQTDVARNRAVKGASGVRYQK